MAHGFSGTIPTVMDRYAERFHDAGVAALAFDQVASPSVLRPPTACRWFMEYGGRYGSGWTNRVVCTAREDAPDFDPCTCAPPGNCGGHLALGCDI